MVQRIIANEAIWKVLAGGVTGQRLAYADAIEAVQAIEIAYAVPSEIEGLMIQYQVI